MTTDTPSTKNDIYVFRRAGFFRVTALKQALRILLDFLHREWS